MGVVVRVGVRVEVGVAVRAGWRVDRPLLSVCDARSEKLNWLRSPLASSSEAPSPSLSFSSISCEG